MMKTLTARSFTELLKWYSLIWFGAVAQSGSASRSHREGQGFKSPQLHPRCLTRTFIGLFAVIVSFTNAIPPSLAG